mmetsp:Transcript_15677/g.35955  ORF Transcript_15677/g.35955 Transcript_15677/m.35955 type:complete len:86 (+) Transcript_15677:1862-2119(+)
MCRQKNTCEHEILKNPTKKNLKRKFEKKVKSNTPIKYKTRGITDTIGKKYAKLSLEYTNGMKQQKNSVTEDVRDSSVFGSFRFPN